MVTAFDVVIVGSGPAGADCALELAKSGKSVAVIEKNLIGGTCLNVGCIPTKSYLYRAKQVKTLKKLGVPVEAAEALTLSSISSFTGRVLHRSRLALEAQFKNERVTYFNDEVVEFDAHSVKLGSSLKLDFKDLILATGTRASVPSLFQPFAHLPELLTNETLFKLETLPKKIFVVGGGVIGIELAFFFATMGVPVTLCELMPSILPEVDIDIVKEIRRQLKLNKVNVLEKTSVESISPGFQIKLSNNSSITVDTLLLATGRQPILPQTQLSLKRNPKGFVIVNETYETSSPHIYAIGDINGISLLAHSASAQAFDLARYIIDKTPPPDHCIPSVVYSIPTAASVGLRSQDIDSHYKVFTIPFNVLGKAQVEENTEGWIKLILLNDQLKGCHIYGPAADDLLPFCTLAIEQQIPLQALASMVYPHPSYGELFKEAFLLAL